MKTILILGKKKDPEVKAVAKQLHELGHRVIYFNKKTVGSFNFTFDVDVQVYTVSYCGEVIEPDSIYWRTLNYSWFDCPTNNHNNEEAFYHIFTRAFDGARWVNTPTSFLEHMHKLPQLYTAGLYAYTPETIATNDYRQASDFFSAVGCDVAVKPVSGGQHTVRFKSATALETHILMHKQPQTIQSYVKGQNIRTYVIKHAWGSGEDIFASRIPTTECDFRIDNHPPVPIDVDEELRSLCSKITDELGYSYTAIDWIKTEDGDYYFLEANFAPCFANYDEMTGHTVTQSIVNLLLNNA